MYEFTYLAHVAADPTFVPVVGFRDVNRRYRSERLFPSFADRVMSAKRPDRPQYLEALDLDADADAWEILTASGGHGKVIRLNSSPATVRSDHRRDLGALSCTRRQAPERRRERPHNKSARGLSPRSRTRSRKCL